MATEKELEKVLRDYLADVPIFANDRTKAEGNGFAVNDVISITLKNPCGHPTGSLIRQYTKHGVNATQLHSTFDLTLKGRKWQVRCSNGYPGPDRD